MDLEIIILIEVSQTEKDEYHMILFYVESKKIDTNKLIYRTETDIEYKFMVSKAERGRRDKLGFGVSVYTLLFSHQILSNSS